MSLVKLVPSPNTKLHASETPSTNYKNIKGVYPNSDGVVSYIDTSGIEVDANVFGGNTPPFIVGDVTISATTADLIILK